MSDVTLIRCSTFGGGWAVPETVAGRDCLADFFTEEPGELMPIGGREGWIVEPWMAADLAHHLNDFGAAVRCA